MNFFQYLKPERIPSASRRKNVLDIRREIILQIVLNTLLGIYTIGFALIMIFYPQVIRSGKPELYLLPYAAVNCYPCPHPEFLYPLIFCHPCASRPGNDGVN